MHSFYILQFTKNVHLTENCNQQRLKVQVRYRTSVTHHAPCLRWC